MKRKHIDRLCQLLAKSLTVTCATLLLAAGPAFGDTLLDNPAIVGGILSIGERPPGINVANEYYAQSFTTPAIDTRVDWLGFFISNSVSSPSFGVVTDAPLPIRVLLTSVVFDATGIRPDQVLFESETIQVERGGTRFLVVDLPETKLQPLTQYAFILDAAADMDLNDAVAPRGSVVSGETYGGGQFFSYRVPWESTGGVMGPRSQHFAANWGDPEPVDRLDMAFTISFVPEPSSISLALLGCVSLCGYVWRRQRRAAK